MTYYGIKMNGKALGFSYRSNGDAEFCNDISYELDACSSNVWLVKNKEYADHACIESTAWYNAGYENPENPYIGKFSMEVFSVEIP